MPQPPLAVPQDLFDWLQKPYDNAAVPQVSTYLRFASGLVRDYLRQDVTATAYTATLPVAADGSVFLAPRPLTTVTSVLDAATTLPLTAPYTVELETGIVTVAPDLVTWVMPPRVTVAFTAGYAEVPDGIVAVVVKVAARGYATPAGVQAEALGGWSVKYEKGQAELTGDERLTLDRYRWASSR